MIKKILILLLLLCCPVYGQWQDGLKPLLGTQIDWSNPLAKGLVGLWLMNEGTGNIVQDLSGNGNTGTFVGTLDWVPGKLGPALSWNAADEYIDFPTITSIPGEVTLIAWVWIPSSPWQMQPLFSFSKDAGTYILLYNNTDATGPLKHWFSTRVEYAAKVTVESDTNVVTNKWIQVAMTRNSAGLWKMFLDGVQQVNTQTMAGALTGLVTHKFGDDAIVGNITFTGKADNLSIYNRALTAGEIADLYTNPFGIIQPTFSVWWYSGIGGEPPATFGQVIMISN